MTKKSQLLYSVISICAVAAYCGFLVKNSISEVDTVEETLPYEKVTESIIIPVSEKTELPEEETETQAAAEIATQPVEFSGFSPLYPITGEIVGAFNQKHTYNPKTKDWRAHSGIDIKGNESDEVICCEDGTVIAAFNDPLWGTVIEIDHGEYVSVYKNLVETTVNVGESISRGTPFASIGKECAAEQGEYHIHFEILHYGEYVDPALLIG